MYIYIWIFDRYAKNHLHICTLFIPFSIAMLNLWVLASFDSWCDTPSIPHFSEPFWVNRYLWMGNRKILT